MNIDRLVITIAGSFIVVSLALGYFVHPAFLLFTLFVGLNLLQAGFTGFCFSIIIGGLIVDLAPLRPGPGLRLQLTANARFVIPSRHHVGSPLC